MTVVQPTAPPAPPPAPPGWAPPSTLQPFWPDPQPAERHPRLLLAGLGVGTLSTVLVSSQARPGLATTLVALAGLAVCAAALGRRGRREDRWVVGLVAVLLGTGLLSSAGWAVTLCGLAGAAVLVVTLTGARGVSGMAMSGLAAGLPFVRGVPWLRRSLPHRGTRTTPVWPVVRTVGLTGSLVGLLVALFASADGVFASWTTGALAGVPLGDVPGRLVLGTFVTGVVLVGVVLAVLPPDVDRWSRRSRPAVRRFEWLGPVGAVGAVFVIFLLAQARGLFGGAAYLERLGSSYAEWVHQGFGQLVAATVVVLVVVGVAARRASCRTAADRRWRRGALGGLCLLALVVAGSALHRLHLYDQAYGATRLRLLVGAFESWVAVVLVLTATVCVRLRGAWVPRVAVLLGAVILAGLTLAGPDRLVAERNVARFAATGQVDWGYLGGLSAEAVPVIDGLPEPYRSCALAELVAQEQAGPRRALDANLAAARARALLAERPVVTITCDSVAAR